VVRLSEKWYDFFAYQLLPPLATADSLLDTAVLPTNQLFLLTGRAVSRACAPVRRAQELVFKK
jgi:hypothetical protein